MRTWKCGATQEASRCSALLSWEVAITSGELERCIVVVASRSTGSGQVDDDGDRLSDLRQRQWPHVAERVDDSCR